MGVSCSVCDGLSPRVEQKGRPIVPQTLLVSENRRIVKESAADDFGANMSFGHDQRLQTIFARLGAGNFDQLGDECAGAMDRSTLPPTLLHRRLQAIDQSRTSAKHDQLKSDIGNGNHSARAGHPH